MHELGLSTTAIQQVPDLPTGIAQISTRSDGEPEFSIPRPAAFDDISFDCSMADQLKPAKIDWPYFGPLLQTNPSIEQHTTELAHHLHPTRIFYDMNLRVGHWELALVQRLSKLASIVKLNELEAHTLHNLTESHDAAFSLEAFCNMWASTYNIDVICITLGADGCMIYDRGNISRVPGYEITVCDTVGSGDAFASAFLHGYHLGWNVLEAARFANALGALVASRSGATPDWAVDEILAIIGVI